MGGDKNTRPSIQPDLYSRISQFRRTCETCTSISDILSWKAYANTSGIITPNCNKPLNGETQLTKHRKIQRDARNNIGQKSKQWESVSTKDAGGRFNAIRDLGRHMRYQCGRPLNPFQNNLPGEAINRKTCRCIGIPHGDLQVYNGGILFGGNQMAWNCAMCNPPLNGYRRNQVYGHVRANHFYQSRDTNERWNIAYREQQDTYPKQTPRHLQSTTQFAINTELDFAKVTQK